MIKISLCIKYKLVLKMISLCLNNYVFNFNMNLVFSEILVFENKN